MPDFQFKGPRFKSSTGQANSRPGPSAPGLEAAESIALQAVAFVAADEEMLTGLLSLTGLDLDGLKTRLGDHDTLAGVLAVLLENEPRLLAFCEAAGLDPSAPAAAHRRLAPAAFDF